MNRQPSSSPAPGNSPGGATDPGAERRRWTIDVRTLLILVFACAAGLWMFRVVRDAVDPAGVWIRQIRSGTREERLDAAGGLAGISAWRVPAAVPALAAALEDEDEGVATAAARSLAQALQTALAARDRESSRLAGRALTDALADPRPAVRGWAATGMAVDGAGIEDAEPWCEALAAALTDEGETAEVRFAAAAALGRLGIGEAGHRALLRALERDPAAPVRIQAAKSLGTYGSGGDQTTLALFDAIRTAPEGLKSAAANALDLLHVNQGRWRTPALLEELTRSLSDPELSIRSHAALALGEMGAAAEPAVPDLIALMQRDGGAARARVGPFPWVFLSQNPAAQAAVSLGEIAPGTRRAQEAVDALAAAARGPSNEVVQEYAVQSLAQFGPALVEPLLPELMESLRAKLEGPPGAVASARPLCFALGRLGPYARGGDAAIPLLTDALGAKEWDLNVSASVALSQFGSSARPAIGRLQELAQNHRVPDWVRKAARDAVRMIEAATETEVEAPAPAQVAEDPRRPSTSTP